MAGYQYSSQNMRKPTRSSNRDATGVQEQRAPMLLPNDSILLLLFGAPVILLPPDTRSGSQRASGAQRDSTDDDGGRPSQLV